MKHFINLNDVKDLKSLVKKGLELKSDPFKFQKLGNNKTLGLLFFNSSLRTRLSTQKAASNLGLNTIVMNVGSDGWQLEFGEGIKMNGNKAEHIKEAAAVVGQYCDIIGVRAFAEFKNRETDYSEVVLESFRKYAGVPIVNLESATRHPCQALTDLITIEEIKPVTQPKIVLSWAPHIKALPQAVANSFAETVLASGQELTICNPEGYNLNPEYTKGATITHNQNEALKDADIVYVKNWSSYDSYGQVLNQDPSWMITKEKLGNAKFMHCLPVRRGLIVEDAVLDSQSSVVIQQAGNRVWAVQTVLKEILEGLKKG